MFTEIPIIATIIAIILAVYKTAVKGHENLIKIIPIIASVLGLILGIVAFYATPDLAVSDNVFVAMLHGLASGLSATGAHQVFKQLFKNTETIKQTDQETENEENKTDDQPILSNVKNEVEEYLKKAENENKK